jgi:alkylglycerol monooxygenase
MDAKYIAIAIPFFFILIAIEVAVGRARGQRDYRLYDAVTSLSCGVGQQIVGVFLQAAMIGVYAWVQAHFGLFAVSPRSPLAWAAILVLLDGCYYAVHRASHRVNAIWATHAVHHQSEDYHLATALRQSWFFTIFTTLFYLPLAVIGFPVVMFVTTVTVNTLYQFWIHTRTVKRIPAWLEWFLNTPSHHRVHHGIDPKYIDKNYGGMFIVFDRMFGTFQPEQEEPHYGTVKPLASFGSWWANFEEWVRIARLSRSSVRFRDKLYAWIAPPEWRPREQGGNVTIPEVDVATYRKFDVPGSRALDAYLYASFTVVAVETSAILWLGPGWPRALAAAACGLVLVNLLAWGGMIEGRRWALPLDLARLGASLGLVAWVGYGRTWLGPVLAVALATALVTTALAVRAARAPRRERMHDRRATISP